MAEGKVHPLWYSPYMHAMFYLSAIPAGLALTVMAIYLCLGSLNVRVDFSTLNAVVTGFIVNRLNVSINALQAVMGAHYVPARWITNSGLAAQA